MELTQINSDGVVIHEQMVKNVLKTINTCIVAEIFEFNPETQRATVRPCVKEKEMLSEGRTVVVSLPQIFDVPVFFPFSGQSGFSITYPVKKGDYCLVIFCQRDIYNWKTYGGEQTTNEAAKGTQRMFDLNDAVAYVGFSPLPFTIKDFQNDAIEVRNADRGVRVRVEEHAVEIETKNCNVTAGAGDVTITAGDSVLKVDRDNSISLTTSSIKLNANTGCKYGATGLINGTSIATVVDGIVVGIS